IEKNEISVGRMAVVALVEEAPPVLVDDHITRLPQRPQGGREIECDREILIRHSVMLRGPVHVPEIGADCHCHKKTIAGIVLRSVEVPRIAVERIQLHLLVVLITARSQDGSEAASEADLLAVAERNDSQYFSVSSLNKPPAGR